MSLLCLTFTVSSFSFACYCAHRYLHSFPTRRSSDLSCASLISLKRSAACGLLGLRSGWYCLASRRNAFLDRKSTRLNSSHLGISYAVFCLKKKKRTKRTSPVARTTDHTALFSATADR